MANEISGISLENGMKAVVNASTARTTSTIQGADLVQLYTSAGEPSIKISKSVLMDCVRDSLGSLLNAAGADQSTNAAKVPTINSSGVLGSSTIANLASVLGVGAEIPNNTDFNTIVTSGWYKKLSGVGTVTNCPVNSGEIYMNVQISELYSEFYGYQIIYSTNGEIYERIVKESSWGSWKRIDNYGTSSLAELANALFPKIPTVPGYVNLGLPSGTMWAEKNIGAALPSDDGLYFSWGNIVGHTGTDGYDFGTTNDGPYASTSGAALTGNIPATTVYDAAVHNAGVPWRIPTKDEFQELYSNCTSEWTDENGVIGRRFTSNINGNSVFFPASGFRSGTALLDQGTSGLYWSSSLQSSANGYNLNLSSGVVNPARSYDRFYGFSVRPVLKLT